MWNPLHPKPAPAAFGHDKIVPERRASPLSRLLFSWLDPFLSVGFSRPLEKEDFWQLPDDQLTENMSHTIERNFYKRCPPEGRPSFMRETEEKAAGATTEDVEANGGKRKKEPKYDSSLLFALHSTFWVAWWSSGVMKLLSDTLNTTTPLVNQLLLSWLTEAFVYHRASEEQRAFMTPPRGIGYGVGLSFALFTMQELSSLLSNHFQMVAMTNGLLIRTSLIGAIFRKSLRLSGRARLDHNVGQITTMISTDTTRLDRNSAQMHNLWVAPIQIAIGIGLLIRNLGASALVGMGVLLLGFPIQFLLAQVMFTQRKKGVVITDQRVRLTSEVLSGIRLIKFYAWEAFYSHQVSTLREREVKTIRRMATARSTLIGTVTVIPILASILSFITYALTGHDLNVAIIFSSLQFFNIIRAPLVFLPLVIAAGTDALVALRRISVFLRAEELAVPYTVDASSKLALDVDGDFTWETAERGAAAAPKFVHAHKKGADKEKKPAKREKDAESASDAESAEQPFALTDLRLQIPRGAFVAIVGPVGSGKSSLLQALIGEMRKTRGSCVFSSTAAYVPQSAWIMNASVRQNVMFGQPEDEARFREIVKACCLEPDLAMLPHGEETEIGEKGINLSGGQKARVSLARAAYSDADIILMDDSLSAVDAYVGKKLLDTCIVNGPLADKTRVLVTHTLHVLDKTDYIYVMDEGKIVEQGTFNELMSKAEVFSRLMEEYGSLEKQEEPEVTETRPSQANSDDEDAVKDSKAIVPSGLMQDEERITGAVAWSVYTKYFRFAGGLWVIAMILLWAVLGQVSQVANSVFLGFWTSQSIPGFRSGDYMGTYAALGMASGVFSFAMSLTISLKSLTAGLTMYKAALLAVLRSPVSFFDTTPLGRIMSRLSKDQDTMDTELAMIAQQLLWTFSSVVGTAGLVFYTFPLLGIIFVPLLILYYFAAIYYRRSSVEAKRLDSIMRSTLYASYSETLTGLSTVRAYHSQDRFVATAAGGLDMENRAYFMTIAIQRWLGVRLDMLGNILILGIALFATGFRNTVDPSKIGVVLSYTLSITQTFSQLVSGYAQNEQNFNAVERVLYYTELPSEGAAETPNDPPASWPDRGEIEFKDAVMSYRPGLPPVLKGIRFEIKPGEKVGIVGRTGAGKSSLLQALFRIVNLDGGSIEIDGQNIADIGLDVLRGRLALVPQDSVLFQGTLRENLDPQNTRTDAELISALQRAWLLPKDGSVDAATEAKFGLDSVVSGEGTNYSAGEKQLLALCRALVKNSRVIVLDEATSSVDVETDAKVQRTIQTEFASSTLLCIAHRLNTIVYYDRILVMDAGRVAEYDTPLALFDREDSIFRGLCNEANLTRSDILRIRAGVHGPVSVPESSASSTAGA